jgi:formylglycine-generating enzyme required for sulfatase activity
MEKWLNFLLCGLLFGGLSGSLAQAQDKTFTNSIGMEFVLIPAGTFMMGSDNSFSKITTDEEKPAHQVTISKPFYLGKYEVTQEQWYAVMGNNPSRFQGRTNPVEQVTWEDVQVFIQKLNQKEVDNKYRLPMEAEWEYAARVGSKTLYFWGDNPDGLDVYVHYNKDTLAQELFRSGSYKPVDGRSQPVGGKKPNPWGLYDIYGNVWEWVTDWYGDYQAEVVTDPTGPATGSRRINRGCSWLDITPAETCRSAVRSSDWPDNPSFYIGFRLAFTPGQ